MGGKNLFIGNTTSLGSLLRNQRDFLIGLHYETESKLCPPNKSFIFWLIRAYSSGRLSLLLFARLWGLPRLRDQFLLEVNFLVKE